MPNCRAILLCEKVIKDAFFGTITIVGILTRFGVLSFPGRTASFFIYSQLAHGLGTYDLTIEVIDDKDGRVIARSPAMPLKFSHRTEVHDIIFQIPPVPLAHAGAYTVGIFADGNEIAAQKFDTPPLGSSDVQASDDDAGE